MDPSLQPQVIVRPKTIRIDRPKEMTFVQDILALINRTRYLMGYTDHGTYTRGSWLWKRAVATRRYANDFTDRLSDPNSRLWRTSNKSLNLVAVVVDQHKAKLSRDFNHTGFVALKPDGPEDQSYILKPTEQFLRKRIERTRLGRKIKEQGIRSALIRGESVFCALPSLRTRTVIKEVKILLHQPDPAGKWVPATDSHGSFITEEDIWIPHSDYPDVLVLQRDPSTQRPAKAIPTYSEKPKRIQVTESRPAGADISFPFWADFVADLDKPDLNSCTIKGHFFEAKVDDLWDMLPRHLLSNQAKAYYDQYSKDNGADPSRYRSEASFFKYKQGEMPEQEAIDTSTTGISATRLYWSGFVRYDLDGDRHREDIHVIIDVQARIPVTYNHAHEVLGNDGRQHAYGILTIQTEEGRWYGAGGYYMKHHDIAEDIDQDFNIIAIEKKKSGNLLFENRNATEEGKAGLPLEFRTPRTFKLVGQSTADKALSAVTISPVIKDVEASLTNNLTAFTGRTGGITPGDTDGAELANNTATGMQILQEVKNDAVEEVREQIMEGPTLADGIIGILRLFTQLELLNLDPGEVKAMFGNARIPTGEFETLPPPNNGDISAQVFRVESGKPPLAAPIPPEGSADTPVRSVAPLSSPPSAPPPSPSPTATVSGPPPTGSPQPSPTTATNSQPPQTAPIQVPITVPIADTLITWSQTLTPDRIHNMVELVVSRSQSSQIITTNENIQVTLERFLNLGLTNGPDVMEIMKPSFVQMLLALDVNNPEEDLDKLIAYVAARPVQPNQGLNTADDPNAPALPASSSPAASQDRISASSPTKPLSAEEPTITGRPTNIPRPDPVTPALEDPGI